MTCETRLGAVFFGYDYFLVGTGTTPAVSYDYVYGRTTQTYDATKTYYQQAAPSTATYAAAAQTYDATKTAAKVRVLTSFSLLLFFATLLAQPPLHTHILYRRVQKNQPPIPPPPLRTVIGGRALNTNQSRLSRRANCRFLGHCFVYCVIRFLVVLPVHLPLGRSALVNSLFNFLQQYARASTV